MKKQLLTLMITAACITGVAACNNSATDKAPGQYTSKRTSVTPNGTKVVTKTDTTVAEDAYGNKTAVVNKKASADPKGLMNKTTTESTTVEEEKY